MATQTTVTKPQTKKAQQVQQVAKPSAKATQKPQAAQKPAAKASTTAAPKNAVTHAQIAALDSMTASGGFYSRAVEYHLGKKNLIPKESGGVIYYALNGAKLIERIKDAALFDAVKAARNTGKSVQGKAFTKAPAGAGFKFAIAEPCEGGKVSQAFFSSLFA